MLGVVHVANAAAVGAGVSVAAAIARGPEAAADAAAGTAGATGETNFSEGLAIFQLTEKGLMASADIAGTRYWKNKKLNEQD